MNTRTQHIPVLVTLGAILLSASVVAQDPINCAPDPSIRTTLDRYLNNADVRAMCVENSAFARTLKEAQKDVFRSADKPESTKARLTAARAMADLFRRSLQMRNTVYAPAADLVRAAEADDALQSNDTWQPAGTTLSAFMGPFLRDCVATQLPAATCEAQLPIILDGISFAKQVEILGDADRGPRVWREVLKAERRSIQWDAYLSNQQFQYPWEHTLNFCIDQPTVKGWNRLRCFVPFYGGIYAAAENDKRAQVGSPPIPSSRFIFLHPDIAMTYSSDQPDGAQVNPALWFEWFGYMRWRWNDALKSEQDKVFDCTLDICPYGISVVSQYADLANHDDIGHGLALHFRNYALSYTRHDGENGNSDEWIIGINLNLSKLLQESGGSRREAAKRLFEESLDLDDDRPLP